MRRGLVLTLLLMLSMPTGSRGDVLSVPFLPMYEPGPINSAAFAIRGPLPGWPPYLATVKYIDDGMRYVDPFSRFFVSPAGEMCFRTISNYPTVIYDHFYRTWCIYPQMVDRVETVTNPTINEVRLWCMRAYPQCVHRFEETDRFANSITAPTLDYRQERAALEHLIYMMGGYVRSEESAASPVPSEPR